MSRRKHYAQKTLTLESEIVEIKSTSLVQPSGLVHFAIHAPMATPIGTVDVTPWAATTLKGDRWTIKAGSPNRLVRGFVEQVTPMDATFIMQLILPPVATPIHRVITAILTRNAADIVLRGFDLDAEDDAAGNPFIRGVSWSWADDFLFGDEVRFTVTSDAVSTITDFILTIS